MGVVGVVLPTVPRLYSGSLLALFAGSRYTFQMLQAGGFAVADVAYFTRLWFRGLLADTVFTEKVGAASICSITKMAFAAKGTGALFRNVWVQRERGQVRETSRWG